jgi:hypothetical protein
MTSVGWVCGLSSGMYKGIQQGTSSLDQWPTIHPKKKVDLPWHACLLRYTSDALAQANFHFFEAWQMHMSRRVFGVFNMDRALTLLGFQMIRGRNVYNF